MVEGKFCWELLRRQNKAPIRARGDRGLLGETFQREKASAQEQRACNREQFHLSVHATILLAYGYFWLYHSHKLIPFQRSLGEHATWCVVCGDQTTEVR